MALNPHFLWSDTQWPEVGCASVPFVNTISQEHLERIFSKWYKLSVTHR